jgi:hypothetical protein
VAEKLLMPMWKWLVEYVKSKEKNIYVMLFDKHEKFRQELL